jgi:glutaredoxin
MVTRVRAVLYTDTMCPICGLMEQYLAERGVEYTKINVDEDPEGKKAFLKLGYDNLPVLDIEGTTILGYDTEAIDNALKRRGDLNVQLK